MSPTYCRTLGTQSGNGEVTVTTAGTDSSGTGSPSFTWKNLTNGDESHNTTFVVRTPGWMKITIEDDNGCLYTDSLYVDSLNPIADFDILSDQFTGPGEYEGTEDLKAEFINLSSNYEHPDAPLTTPIFQWNLYRNEPDYGESNWFFAYSPEESVTRTYRGDQEYLTCLVTKNFNNCKDTICKLITVNAIPELKLPNVFTPGSPPNDRFYFPNRGIDYFTCSVYNRYGIEVYRFTGPDDQWDGTNFKNGMPCTNGVYYYTYQAVTNSGKVMEDQGEFSLSANIKTFYGFYFVKSSVEDSEITTISGR